MAVTYYQADGNDGRTLMHEINDYFGYPSTTLNGTRRFSPIYTSGANEWIACHANYDTELQASGALSGTEISTRTTTQPGSWKEKEAGYGNEFMPGRIPIMLVGDSITEESYLTYTDRLHCQLLQQLSGTGTKVYSTYMAYDDTYCIINEGVSSSRYDYTGTPTLDWLTQRAPRVETISYPGSSLWVFNLIGSNDLSPSHGAASAATVWTRAQSFISSLASHDTGIKVVMSELIDRSTSGMTSIITSYNSLVEAGWSGAGAAGFITLFDTAGLSVSGDNSGFFDTYVHPGVSGVAAMAANIGPQLEAIITA